MPSPASVRLAGATGATHLQIFSNRGRRCLPACLPDLEVHIPKAGDPFGGSLPSMPAAVGVSHSSKARNGAPLLEPLGRLPLDSTDLYELLFIDLRRSVDDTCPTPSQDYLLAVVPLLVVEHLNMIAQGQIHRLISILRSCATKMVRINAPNPNLFPSSNTSRRVGTIQQLLRILRTRAKETPTAQSGVFSAAKSVHPPNPGRILRRSWPTIATSWLAPANRRHCSDLLPRL